VNNLPTHRSVLHGRTWGRTWSASEFDPITRYQRGSRTERAAGVVLAVLIGIFGALLLIHELAG
jgi:hypothetical protein